jgi:coenzyme PQQ precursor peptide PqqA
MIAGSSLIAVQMKVSRGAGYTEVAALVPVVENRIKTDGLGRMLPNGRKKLAVLFFHGMLHAQSKVAILLSDNLRPEWAAGGIIMEWTAPSFEEVCLNCEINSYASAKL